MIVLFGVVGSGKSEQASRLVAKLGCPYITTSRLIRDRANPQWQELIMAGKLLPDEAVLSILEPELAKIDAANKEFILDGAPRSIGQAEWLIGKIKNGEVKLTAIIHLVVSRRTAMERLLKRGREDDEEDIVSERFRQFDSVTTPVLNYLRSQNFTVNEVDGEWSSDVVERQIWAVLEGKVEAKVG
ncbi:nucleoside monophosphate kinase [Candidatus Saccharibacteria bacterium]|nr:nucleoside monophosphate kinase [Candidatus Saccharibacteria bacterium]